MSNKQDVVNVLEKMYYDICEPKTNINETVTTSGAKNLCIDFDGVVHKYSKGFYDGTIYDEPSEGVREALELLSKKYKLICWSARINDKYSKDGKVQMISWLKKYDLFKFFSDITDQKIPAIAYIDDNAIRHTDWSTTLNNLRKLGRL